MGYLEILQFPEDCGLNLSPDPKLQQDLHCSTVVHGHENVAFLVLNEGFQ